MCTDKSVVEIPNQVAVPNKKVSVIKSLAEKLMCDPSNLSDMLKKTAFSNCRNNEEFMAMCMVANQYGLNPLTKEIYAFPTKSGGIMPLVSVDGWIKIMHKNPHYDSIEFEETEDSCTAIIWRNDKHHPTKITEYLSECFRKTEPWQKWPRRMLRNKALIQCARIAFGFSGIYDPDECERTSEAIYAEEVKHQESHEKLEKLLKSKPAEKLRKALKIEKVDEPVTAEVEEIDLSEEGEPLDAVEQDPNVVND